MAMGEVEGAEPAGGMHKGAIGGTEGVSVGTVGSDTVGMKELAERVDSGVAEGMTRGILDGMDSGGE
jgi:hypothetical protein